MTVRQDDRQPRVGPSVAKAATNPNLPSVSLADASRVVALSRFTSDALLPTLARRLCAEMEPGRIAILDFRLDHTQESVGDRIGVTRQRTQQLEQKARAQVTPVILSWAEPFKQRWA